MSTSAARRSELIRDLVAPVIALVVIGPLLAVASLLPTICNGVQLCPPANARPILAFVFGVALLLAFVLAVVVRVRNDSGIRTRAETATFAAMIVIGAVGVLLTVMLGGMMFPPML